LHHESTRKPPGSAFPAGSGFTAFPEMFVYFVALTLSFRYIFNTN